MSAGEMQRLTLITPTEEYEAEYRAFLQEAEGVRGMFPHNRVDNFGEFVAHLQRHARGEGLTEGQIPISTFWLVRDGVEIVGISRLRHTLVLAGHIGFHIRPSMRQRGYGSHLLALTLEKARAIGLPRVQLVCLPENTASQRVIEKNGGVFSDAYTSENTGLRYLRFWIELITEERGR